MIDDRHLSAANSINQQLALNLYDSKTNKPGDGPPRKGWSAKRFQKGVERCCTLGRLYISISQKGKRMYPNTGANLNHYPYGMTHIADANQKYLKDHAKKHGFVIKREWPLCSKGLNRLTIKLISGKKRAECHFSYSPDPCIGGWNCVLQLA